MSFDELIGAIRASDGEDPALAAATQLRVQRSLEVRARSRHQLAGFLTAAAILFGGTVSWALATGRVTALWAPAPPLPELGSEVVAPPPPAPPPRGGPARSRGRAIATPPRAEPSADIVPETVPPAPAAPAPSSPPAPPAAPAPAPARPPRRPVIAQEAPPVEVLYRQAHELHFRGGDPAATLAAWDGYLAAEPAGRFSVEARYNRAIVLVRLGRYGEARRALVPFARGEVEPAGYRQAEAEQLVERLARHE
jgi:hypothetical protein